MSEGDKLEGFFWKTANGRQSYEIYKATPDFILVAAKILHERFGFSKAKKLLDGIDHLITDCAKDDVKLLLGWDNWSGFYLMSDSDAGDAVVIEVGNYFESIIQQTEFDNYIHHW
jgi:hypothetical protein